MPINKIPPRSHGVERAGAFRLLLHTYKNMVMLLCGDNDAMQEKGRCAQVSLRRIR